MASGLELEMVSGMVTEMVSELEMALGMLSESKLIDWARLFRGDPRCLIGSSSPFFTLFLIEMDVIAVLEEC